MAWWFEVIGRKHEIQNPTSRDKILLLGERLGLAPHSLVLDMGSGRGGPAAILASSFGCYITCVERSEVFLAASGEREEEAGIGELIEHVHSDGKEFTIEPEHYDAALCLGATFVYGGLDQTVSALAPGVKLGGFVVVGEPYWRRWPLPEGFEPEEGWDFLPLAETVTRFEAVGVEFVSLIASSQDDWDRYESLHWFALEEWLHENPDDPDAEEFRKMGKAYRDAYLLWHRDLLGWGIFIGRKRRTSRAAATRSLRSERGAKVP